MGNLIGGGTSLYYENRIKELEENENIVGEHEYIGYYHEHTWGSQKYLAMAVNLPLGFNTDEYDFTLNKVSSVGHTILDKTKFSLYAGVGKLTSQLIVTTDSEYINNFKDSFGMIFYTITKK